MQQTVSILVKGKVQGVFYRQSTKETAIRLGITGEVKNLADGNVQIIATGTEAQLKDLTNWCHKGPPRAVVTEVTIEKIPARSFSSFSIVR
ncbi:MAG: acylphosphatase [Chitinophagaceae bacterium]